MPACVVSDSSLAQVRSERFESLRRHVATDDLVASSAQHAAEVTVLVVIDTQAAAAFSGMIRSTSAARFASVYTIKVMLVPTTAQLYVTRARSAVIVEPI